MKFGAMKTWMIAGVIALAGGTTAFVALDVTGTNNGPAPFVAQSEPADVSLNNDAPRNREAADLDGLFVDPAPEPATGSPFIAAEAVVETAGTAQVDPAADAAVELADAAAETVETAPADDNVAVSAPANAPQGDERDYLRTSVDVITADLLSLSVDELAAAREAGQSTGDLLAAAGISRERHQAAVADAWPTIIQTGVDAGVISAEQAADLLEDGPRVRNGNQNNNDQNDNGDGNRDGNGRGRGRGNGGNNQGNPPSGDNA